ncbi:MAG: pyridoxine 5'-phosphate synthase [Nitrospiria bacterium]
MTKLGVNVDHVATLREARKGSAPDPIAAAVLAELAGADGIVVHLREDRRHVQERDVRILRETIQTKLDLELAATEEMVRIASKIKPDFVTFVPERREELTTEGGLDVVATEPALRRAIEFLHEKEIAVALFLDPVPYQIEAAHKLSVDMIELHTGRYANARPNSKDQSAECHQIMESAKFASQLGLSVNAGHGLDYHNVTQIAQVPIIEELNIGHSIISRAVLVGIEAAVREMKRLISGKTP